MKRPAIVAVSGFSSEVGKTTLYLSNVTEEGTDERQKFALWRKHSGMDVIIGDLPIYTREEMSTLVALVQKIEAGAHRANLLLAPTSKRRSVPART